MICFGGESVNPKTLRTTTADEVMVLDTEIMLWYPPSVTGDVPSGRSGHSASLLGSDLVVFGGVKGSKFQSSLYVLDTARWKWSQPKINGDTPRPRSYHTATSVQRPGGKHWMVVFGGNDRSKSFDTVHVLEKDKDQWTWIHPTVSGEAPAARTGHSAILMPDRKTILVQGGWDPNVDGPEEENIFCDAFCLDITTWTWRKEEALEMGRRVGHTAAFFDGQVIAFAGRTPGDMWSNEVLVRPVPSNPPSGSSTKVDGKEAAINGKDDQLVQQGI